MDAVSSVRAVGSARASRVRRGVALLCLAGFASLPVCAELHIDDCVTALRKAPKEMKCQAAYKTTTPAELALLAKLSYGIVQVTTCDVTLAFDVPLLTAQYRAKAPLKLAPVRLKCSMQTHLAEMPIELVAMTHLRLAPNGAAETLVADQIDVVGYPDIYESQILRFVNDNRDLGGAVARIFNENLSVFAGR
jgi:hypothetical protein